MPKTAHFSQALKTSSLMSASIFGRDNNSDSDMHTSPIFTTCIVVLTAVLIAAGILIYRILFPAIISYPWDMPGEKSRQRKREKKMAVVFAGSFNPPHWGHLVMIRYLVERGIRTWNADGPDERKLQILNTWGPLLLGPVWPLKTVFLEGDPQYRDVSSTLVRSICSNRRRELGNPTYLEELSMLVPESVVEMVTDAYGR
ncbi:predicted protein [Thalassiosira pseudonana CCMP1335]|uniref:Uncharacterized protein n=1 Tax=Thalassiosira pseudonana TaxID=35128 RepID=B8C5V2_THAPS|nr:predicted protein [Thalassiosira pseudonana CCMP1335]EED91571.1 predicted protein [Thalassiosira pseudonana CCMP1335]